VATFPISDLIPLGGSVVLMTLLLKMWVAERVRWIRERTAMIEEHQQERKALIEEHNAELRRRDDLCEKRVEFWREIAERQQRAQP
jgi:hypothetical protein